MKLYALYDSKAGVYDSPFCSQNDNTAVRMVTDVIKTQKSFMASHAADFSIYYLGEYNNDTGDITIDGKPVFTVSCSALVPEFTIVND